MPATSILVDRVHDVLVYGAGYAGFAAYRRLTAEGLTVALVDRRPAPLWESAWAFADAAGESRAAEWAQWRSAVAKRGGWSDGIPDGAISEALAAETLRQAAGPTCLYLAPILVERSGAAVTAVTFAGKAGLMRVRARRWIDASEDAELLALIDRTWRAPAPQRRRLAIMVRRHTWMDAGRDRQFTADALPDATLGWSAGGWANERRLTIDLPGTVERTRSAWLPALTALTAQVGADLEGAVVTHGSVEAFPIHGGATLPGVLPANVAAAVPGWAGAPVATLAARFDLGLAAAARVLATAAGPAADPAAAVDPWSFAAMRVERDVGIAGAGTGGVVAALAAARAGAATTVIEPLPFAGGIGAGGGIHTYYFGVKGGLQEEVDARVRAIMPLFGRPSQVVGFHPDAKKIALEDLLVEAGVDLRYDATVVAVRREGRRIVEALATTPAGPVRLAARAWIDASGDGDLCAMAGARSLTGRAGDGLPHAYTQSSGRAGLRDGKARLDVINYDAGFVDPTDPVDLTRARLIGASHYVQERFGELERPTYLAPAIGLRQARQLVCDYTITLDDLIVRRRFADGVGLTGCHYDNHAVDYEFESDESLFWVWGCRSWNSGRTGGDIPYRALVPADLDNAWIACRALGVSQDAHHSLRMQRDIQRIGEVAGLAAAISLRHGADARTLPFPELRQALVASGAVADRGEEDDFGFGVRLERQHAVDTRRGDAADWLIELRGAQPGVAMWRLAHAGDAATAALLALLDDADPGLSWRAAVVLAARGDARAEPRLLRAITTREDGFDTSPDGDKPARFNRVVPNWHAAAGLLRLCGTAACLPALDTLVGASERRFHVATTVALTCERLAGRMTAHRPSIAGIVERIRVRPPGADAAGDPQRNPTVPGEPRTPATTERQPVIEDRTWQFHLAVAKARLAVGQPIHAEALALRDDPRALVRCAIARLGAPVSARKATAAR